VNLVSTSTATTHSGLKGRATICAVRAHRLAQQPPGLPDGLPDELLAVAVPPAGPTWAEHRVRFVLEFVGDGVSGWHGPVSETILTIIRDAHAPGLLGHDAAEHRRLPYRKVLGRHHHGSYARQAQAAVELACWDLASRACGRTVSELLGGSVRHHVPLYATALGLDLSHPAAPAAAGWIHAAGFWGQKWALPKKLIADGPRAVSARLKRLQEAAPQGRFMVDGLGRCRADEAVRLLPILADLWESPGPKNSFQTAPGPGSGCEPLGVPLLPVSTLSTRSTRPDS
jgi:L-rhamnonate dehydratase